MKSNKNIAEAVNKASDLTIDEKEVLSFIVCKAYISGTRSSILGDDEIARATGINTDRIADITSSLVRKGYLTKKGVY